MTITTETVKYVARLSRLEVSDDDLDIVASNLTSILDYMDEINASINTDSVGTKIGVLTTVMRPDIVKPSMERDVLLKNAPDHTEETIIVPRTVD